MLKIKIINSLSAATSKAMAYYDVFFGRRVHMIEVCFEKEYALGIHQGQLLCLWTKPHSIDVHIFGKGFGIAAEPLGTITDAKLYKAVNRGQVQARINSLDESRFVLDLY